MAERDLPEHFNTGGFDTHANQNPVNGAYNTLMAKLNNGLIAF